MLVVVLNPLCPVRYSLLLYCRPIYFCSSVPNKTTSIRISTSLGEITALLQTPELVLREQEGVGEEVKEKTCGRRQIKRKGRKRGRKR